MIRVLKSVPLFTNFRKFVFHTFPVTSSQRMFPSSIEYVVRCKISQRDHWVRELFNVGSQFSTGFSIKV